MSTSIFVTGGSGFLGSHLVARLHNTGFSVYAPGRNELHLGDVHEVERALRERSIDVVVHLAASLDRGADLASRNRQWKDTFEAGRNVLLASGEAGVKSVIAAGSMDEIGILEGVIAPTSPSAPINTYGLCKSLLAEIARFVSQQYKMSVEWFRPSAIYGPGQEGPMLVPSAFKTALVDGEGSFTSGEQRRNFIYIDDVVDWIAHALCVESSSDPRFRIHHIGSPDAVAVKDVLSRVAELTGASFRLGAVPRRAGEPDLVTFPPYSDERKPIDEWRPSVDLQEGLSRTYAWWRKS